MKLRIEPEVRAAMVRAAEAAAPLEACGLIGGRDGRLTRLYNLTNLDASAEHYMLDPEEQFAAVKDMRVRGLELLAIWHSHPATPARMSEEDLELAYTPDVVYLIVSLASPEGPELRGFTVREGRSDQVELEIVGVKEAKSFSQPEGS